MESLKETVVAALIQKRAKDIIKAIDEFDIKFRARWNPKETKKDRLQAASAFNNLRMLVGELAVDIEDWAETIRKG